MFFWQKSKLKKWPPTPNSFLSELPKHLLMVNFMFNSHAHMFLRSLSCSSIGFLRPHVGFLWSLFCCHHFAASGRRRRHLADAPSRAWTRTPTWSAGGGCGRLGTTYDWLGGGRQVGGNSSRPNVRMGDIGRWVSRAD